MPDIDQHGVRTVQVTGRFIKGLLDGPDAGVEPDATPLQYLSITLTPTPTVCELFADTPPTTMILAPFDIITDVDGQVQNPETDDKVIRIPADFQGAEGLQRIRWKSEVRLTVGGGAVITKEWVVPLDATAVDLTTVDPIPGTTIINLGPWEQLKEEARAAKELAVLAAAQAAQAKADAQGFKDDAETARDEALSHAELFVAPAKGVLDSIMGGDVDDLALRVARLKEVATNVRDYGATGDGVSDDSAAIQAALNAAGVGARVIVPPGIYKCSSTITTPLMSSLEGSTLEIGVGGTGRTELRFTAVAGAFVGVALGASSSLSNIIVRGPGTATGTTTGITGATVRLTRVAVLNWVTGVSIVNGYYAQFTEVEWNRNGTGLLLTGCYNVNLYGPRFSGGSTVSASTDLGVAINGGARGLNIFGGSIELYKTGILVKSAETVNLYGVYFETEVDAAATAVSSYGKNDVTININGCFAYLNGHIFFVSTVNSTDVCLLSTSNHFVCATSSVQAPIAYNMTAGQDVSLRGDNWKEVVKTGSSYAAISGGAGFNTPGMTIQWPKGHPGAYGGAARPETGARTQLSVDVAQTVAVTGAVSMDATYASHAVTLQANATSSTITNGISGQQITVTVIQDATGGRSFVWPTNAAFAGGAAPATSPANTRTTVTFKYSSTVNRWHEVGRVQGVPVS